MVAPGVLVCVLLQLLAARARALANDATRQGASYLQAKDVANDTSNTYKVQVTPQSLMQCNRGRPARQTTTMTQATYQDIVDEFARNVWRIQQRQDEEERNRRLAHFGGCILRMAGHDFMDFVPGPGGPAAGGVGGSDACTDMDEGSNAGLKACLSEGHEEYGDEDLAIQTIYANYCTQVSLADFVVIAAEAMMFNMVPQEMKDMAGNFKKNFKYGRVTRDGEDCRMPKGILPNPDNSCNDVERVFVTNMGLSWRQATALMGVHSIGMASPQNSGFKGFWDTLEHAATFNNHYYVNMLTTSWCPETVGDEKKNKTQWRRCEQVKAEQPEDVKNQMMLNTDLCLAFTAPDGKGILSAKDTPCCSWVHSGVKRYPMGDVIKNDNFQYCTKTCAKVQRSGGKNQDCFSKRTEERICCAGDPLFKQGAKGAVDCGTPGLGLSGRNKRRSKFSRQGFGELSDSNKAVREFAADANVWMEVFFEAWTKATELGTSGLTPLEA